MDHPFALAPPSLTDLHHVVSALALAAGQIAPAAAGGWQGEAGVRTPLLIMLAVLGIVLAMSAVLPRPAPGHRHRARLRSIIWSAALLLGLLFTWRVIAAAERWVDPVGTPITSAAELDAFIAAHPESFAGYDYLIPTGVYLQSFEFLNASNVEMSGFVWQTYSADIPDHVRRGIVLPEALEEAYEAAEAWRVEVDGGEQIGWYFSGEFRQNFDYRFYPFDRQDIWLQLWSPEAVEGVALVPDFDAYRDLTPSSLPGIDTQFVYGAWDPVAAGFSYDLRDYNVDFGLGYGFSGALDPELYFNLGVARDSLGPLLKHLVLHAAIAVLLFVLLLLMAHESEVRELVGLTIFDLVVATGGLLFAVILDLQSIRNDVESQTVTYLEWVPLVLNVFIVLVALSAVLRLRHWRVPFFGFQGELMPVLAFWPALFGTLLVITLVVFFV